MDKCERLRAFFSINGRGALGFSGGVDSSYLLYAARACGADVRPYYVKSAFQPRFELEDAKRLARSLGTELMVLEADILSNAIVAANPPDRCYHCKRSIFGLIRSRAALDGYPMLLDGTNASDDIFDRPGMKALDELGVRSPLRECGLTKSEIRDLSREAGLFTWDKPAYACLATRVPSGRSITEELLRRVEGAEDALFRLGFSDFRVRVYQDAARLQLPKSQMRSAAEAAAAIREQLKPFFDLVYLDLAGRP
jgi:uncharacterized protein